MGQKEETHAMHIFLSEAQRNLVEGQVASGRFPSASDYLVELIRRDQREAARAELEAALRAGQDSGPAEAFGAEFFERQRERIRQADPGESKAS
jgi:antitoxin ParD1/3/4